MTYEYTKRSNDDGDAIGCHFCGCEVPLSGFDWGPPYGVEHETDKKCLCEICATTEISNAAQYGRDVAVIARMLAQMGNVILDRIGR